jgi:MoxR-like ATPase
VAHGASPRGGQALILGAKVRALLDGRPHVTPEDVDAVAHASLAHRLVLRFAAEADGADPHRIVDAALHAARRSRG